MASEKTKRPIEVGDLYKINHIEDPQISPDGKWIAFVRVQVDKQDNGYKRNLWLSSTSGGKPRQLTRSGKDSQPRWSPDSQTLAFVSGRDGKPQIYLLPMITPGGEARALTSMKNGASSPDWSPDGTRIAFLSASTAEEREKEDQNEKPEPPKDKLEGKHRKEREEEDEKKRLDPMFVWRVPYRVGTSFLDGRYAQLYIIPVAEDLKEEDKKPKRLTSVDADHDAPVWSPDGKYLYTARQINITEDEPFRKSGIYRIPSDGGEAELLTDETHTCFAPLPSPDGKWLAYVRNPITDERSLTESISRLAVMPAAGGATRDLNLELDRSLYNMEWTVDSASVVFAVGDWGDTPFYRANIADGKTEALFRGRFQIEAMDVSPKGDVVFTASTPVNPGELYRYSFEKQNYEPITEFNKEFLDEVIVQETHEMRFRSPAGIELQGWYILPVGYEEGQRYPLALNIHGGPHVMWGPATRTMFHEWQFHAARGYAVFYCNPRGGDGYGEGFLRSLHKAWGHVAFDDIMAGVDAFLQKGIVDEKRMAVTGGSYGGYMTAWIVGHTNRFASAVTQRGVYNLISFYGTSDVPSLISSEFDVHPWEDHELLWKHSPIAYAQNIKTPLLIIHSENDFRVPIEQGEQLFAFVRRSGGTVEMWRFPREGHELSRSGEPEHRVARLTKMVEWFDKYCMPTKTNG